MNKIENISLEKSISLPAAEKLEMQEICLDWICNSKCAPPPPHFIKLAVLLRHSIKGCYWIESGTYLGETALFLSKFSLHVHTIEPSNECFQIAKKKLIGIKNITMHKGSSEDCLEKVLGSVNGKVCFWLDGHFSSGVTFKGANNTPIKFELSRIEEHKKKFDEIVILIDDIRMSAMEEEDYPPLEYYINWAKSNNLNWTIEHDIFIAKSKHINLYGSS
tara:strand:- start:401 stop:1057 length:657 start_codon:yes stop_codon:yes gene_type:complete